MPDPAETPLASTPPSADVAAPDPHNAERADAEARNGGTAVEIGGRDGPDPTRYGDWEKNGRCIDF